MARERILVIDTDIDHLSRIYLALLHRNYKTEACIHPGEIKERMKRFRPSLIILPTKEYEPIKEKLKIPAIVFGNAEVKLNDGDSFFKKPVHLEQLLKRIEEIVF